MNLSLGTPSKKGGNIMFTKRFGKCKSLAAVILCLSVLLSSACGKNDESDFEKRDTRSVEKGGREASEQNSSSNPEIGAEGLVVTGETPYFAARELDFYIPAEGADYTNISRISSNEKNIAILVNYSLPYPEEVYMAWDNGEDIEIDYSLYDKYEVYIIDHAGTVQAKIDLNEVIDGGVGWINQMKLTDTDELLFTATSSGYSRNEEEQNQAWIYRIDMNGELIGEKQIISIETNKSPGMDSYVNSIFIDHEGFIYVKIDEYGERASKGIISVYSPDEEELFSLEDNQSGKDAYGFGYQLFSNGEKVYISLDAYTENGKTGIFEIDKQKKALGDELDLSDMGVNMYGDFVFNREKITFSDESGVFEVDLAKKEKRTVFTWADADLNAEADQKFVNVLAEDKVFLGTSTYKYDVETETGNTEVKFYILERAENPHIGKKLIRIGGFGINWETTLKSIVYEYNRNNDEYRIEIVDYWKDIEYKDEADWSQKYKELINEMNLDILTGNAPDIIYGDLESFSLYMTKGILVDLNTFMENDPDMKKEVFFENILELGSYDGKLYKLFNSFYISGLVSFKSMLGERTGWTLNEFEEFAGSMPPGMRLFADMTQEYLFQNIISASGQNFYDISKNTVNFDSQAFREALLFSQKYGEKEADYNRRMAADIYEDPYEMVGRKELALMQGYISAPDDFLNYDRYFGEPTTFIGYPSLEDSGLICYTRGGISIVDRSSYKDEAWLIVKSLFEKDKQKELFNQYELPIRKDVFNERLEQMINAPDEDVPAASVPFGGMPEYENWQTPKMTREKADEFLALIGRIDTTAVYDEKIMNLINEETSAFFAGSKSIEEVVRVLQDRVQTLLNER